MHSGASDAASADKAWSPRQGVFMNIQRDAPSSACLLYTSDAADERSSVDLGGRRIIKKKKKSKHSRHYGNTTQKTQEDESGLTHE